MYSQTSDQNAFRPTTAQGSSSRRQDNKSLLSFKVKSMESIETKQNSSKDQIKALQMTLKQKCEEYVQVEQQIEQNRKEGDLMIDFVNDQIREYSMLVSVQSRGKTLDIDTLKKQKQELKNQTMQLHNQNRVALFEIDVQKQMISKLQQSKTQLKKKIQLYDDYIKKTETKFKQRQPNLDLGEMPQVNKKKPQQAIGIVQKTQDEILGEKNQLIEEYDKKIDQLTFQIQEITRTQDSRYQGGIAKSK
ncbi:hypothetical protein pb186bvf_007174 [Paramecium bursaria]